MAVQPVFLSPLVDQLEGFGLVFALQMIQHLFTSYRAIDEIDLEENAVKMMRPYDPTESLFCLIDQLEKGREFAHAGGQTIADVMMVYKGITLLSQTSTFDEDI